MQKLSVQLTGSKSLKALQELEDQHLIRIVNEPNLNSYSLPGGPMSEEDFKNWVEYSENSPTVSYSEAKKRWAVHKKKLQKHTR